MNEKYEKLKFIVSKLKFRIFRDFPFYSDLALNREYILIDDDSLWFATTGDKIIISTKALEFNFEENLFALLHELKHIMFSHTQIAKKFNDKDKFLLNIAQDIIVNELTQKEIYPSEKLRKLAVWKENFKELENLDVLKLTHLEIYDILFKKYNKTLNSLTLPLSQNQSLEDFLKNFKKDFNEFEKQLEKNKELSETEKEIFKQAFKDFYFQKWFDSLDEKTKEEIIKKIKEDVYAGYVNAKQRGRITADLENFVEHIFKKVRDWKKVLREEILETIKGDWSWVKISDNLQSLHLAGFKQIGNLPSLDDTFTLPSVVIGVDTSGSISDEEYKDFLNEIYSIFKSIRVNNFEVVMWEAEITKTFSGRNGIVKEALKWLKERRGYGGTNLRSFLEYCNKKTFNKIAIILTDGEFENDLKANEFRNFKKVIFVISKNGTTKYIPKDPKIKILKIR